MHHTSARRQTTNFRLGLITLSIYFSAHVLRLVYKKAVLSHKDDRAMRHMGALNFRDSLTTPTATIPNIFMVFCSNRAYEYSYKIWSP